MSGQPEYDGVLSRNPYLRMNWKRFNTAMEKIRVERARQERLRGEGKFSHTAASDGISNGERMCILAEEVGEVAGAILQVDIATDRPFADLEKELIHVAAVVVAWLERYE